MSFRETLSQELEAHLESDAAAVPHFQTEDEKSYLVKSVVRSLLEIVIDIRDRIIEESSEDEQLSVGHKIVDSEEIIKYDNDEYRQNIAGRNTRRQSYLYSAALYEHYLSDAQREIEIYIAYMKYRQLYQLNYLQANEKRINYLLYQYIIVDKSLPAPQELSRVSPDIMNADRHGDDHGYYYYVQKSPLSAPNVPLEETRRNSNLLDDKNGIIYLICSISEIEGGGKEDYTRVSEQHRYIADFIAAKQMDQKNYQPSRISTFSYTEYHNDTRNTAVQSDAPKTFTDASLLLTYQNAETSADMRTHSPKYGLPQETKISKIENAEPEDNTMNFNYIDYNQFYRLKIVSPKKQEGSDLIESRKEAQQNVVQAKRPRKSSVERKSATALHKEHRVYEYRYSQRIYELGAYLKEKNDAIEKLRSYVTSTKSLASSQYHVNETLRSKLKTEQDNRLAIQNEMIKVKQEYYLKLYRERQQHYSINKSLLKELGYIRNEKMRNSYLGLSHTMEIPQYRPPEQSPYTEIHTEVVDPPSPKNPKYGELSLSSKDCRVAEHAPYDGVLLDTLVDQMYAKTISEEVKQKLSERYKAEVKLGLREQLLKAIQNYSGDYQLHFTPVRIKPQDPSPKIAPHKYESSPTKEPEIKIVDPPSPVRPSVSMDSSVNIPLTLVQQSVHDMQQDIDRTVFIRETEKNAKPPYIQLDAQIHSRVPPRVRLEPQSESSDISHLSKVRSVRIKTYGEVGCLFLIKVDDAQIKDEGDVRMFDAIKALSGAIPSIPAFVTPEAQQVEDAARFLENSSASYVSVLLKSILFLVFFTHFGALPDALYLSLARLCTQLSRFYTFDARISYHYLNLAISCCYLAVLRNEQTNYDTRAPALCASVAKALQQLNLILEDVEFSPFKTTQIVIYLSAVRVLRTAGAGTPQVYGQFAVATGQLAAQMRTYCERVGGTLLNYQVVAVSCVALLALELGACEMDRGTQDECLVQCQRVIEACKDITKVPGFDQIIRK